MKRVVSIVGARPNFMKVAPIHRAFEKYKPEFEHLIVHTGQHYDAKMSDAFFKDLEMPRPAYFMGVGSGSHAEQTGKIMIEFEKICKELNPDLLIVVGDVNSTIACALTAVKLGVKVVHVEGGLRSFDRDMPEEINRMATDAICDYCFVTEESGKLNLQKQGYGDDRIFFMGNTMIDSQKYALESAAKSDVLKRLDLIPKEYVLMTLHRPSNVDHPDQLKDLLDIFEELSKDREIVFPIHPRTLKNIEKFGWQDRVDGIKGLKLIDPVGYIDFLALMQNSDFVMTDSGGIQEETTALGVHCLTVRTTTERPSTIELGTNILVHPDSVSIRSAINKMLNEPRKVGQKIPLWDGKAAERIAEVIVDKILAD